jgi:hypothetical protein
VITPWRVSLRIGRDDHAPLTHEAVARLSEVLADDRTEIEDRDPEAVVVTMTVDARNEWEARSAAEDDLRVAADTLWPDLGLPPFTITFAAVVPDTGGKRTDPDASLPLAGGDGEADRDG